MGKLLRVDLNRKDYIIEDIDPNYYKLYFGGMGISTKIFTSEVPADIDAFDERNLLIFSIGPFCGTNVPFCGRHYVMAKSPLTNILGESSAGGFWGKELSWTGFSHIIIKEKSQNPVYLWINNNNVEFRDASAYWGKGVFETHLGIKREIGDENVKISSIGPAGENLVKISAIITDDNRAAARCGLGAVMGSKKLKAIAVRGTNKPEVKYPETLEKIARKIRELVKSSPNAVVHHEYGTPIGIDALWLVGEVPMKNYTMSKWNGSKNIGGEALKARGVKKTACFNCPTACTNLVEWEGKWIRAPEYETLAMMGTNLLIDDLEIIIKWNHMIDDNGLDTISLGATISSFLESVERNLLHINLDEFGFRRLETSESDGQYQIWGAKKVIEDLITLVASRKGIGNQLAEGVKNFCDMNKLPDDLKTHAKGLEVPAHEPRSNNLAALDFATTSRGAYHCYEPFGLSSNMNFKRDIGLAKMIDRFSRTKEMVEAVIKIQDASETYSACGGCLFGFQWIEEISPWVSALNAILGTSFKVKHWMETGARLFNMKREYNLKCGITGKDDTLGGRFLIPILKGGTKKNVPPLNELIPLYYRLRNWTNKGIPQF